MQIISLPSDLGSHFFRYTSLVDRYVPNIATGLKDSASLVRRQTLTLLTHLLQVLYMYAAHGKLNLKTNVFISSQASEDSHLGMIVSIYMYVLQTFSDSTVKEIVLIERV